MTAGGPVLLADDSAVVRKVLRDRLLEHGWQVVEAADGQEALDLARGCRPEVVLLDIEMPRKNGYQVLAELKGDPGLSDVPVIFLTARDSSADVAEGLRRGAHDYLRKPFETSELVARLMVARRTRALRDELRRRNAELERLAATDVLTGLSNRRSLQEQLDLLVSRSARHGTPLSALLVDVDHFKAVNDRHGHAAGDEVLRVLAGRLRLRLRLEDACGRWGGEEFLVLLPDTPAAAAVGVAEDLLTVASGDPVRTHEGPVRVSLSIGVAGWDGDSADALLHRADAALYAAKAAGRATVRTAEPAAS